ncbi:MAG: FHA domain-containing protein [Actinomycetia bacterium]|nr:FHA domain-containing protein [Actinomycetes bacterium]
MPLQVTYQGKVDVVDDDVTALIGSDAASTIRIVRPGISRRHAVVSYDGTSWKIEDAGSRNGTFKDGQRVQVVAIEEPMTIYLGHPTDGEAVLLTPGVDASIDEPTPTEVDDVIQAEVDEFVLPETAPPPVVIATSTPTEVAEEADPVPAAPRTRVPSNASDADLDALTTALRDQISAVKGLTWSVWAMIAVTAALAVMTLFVGVLGS